MPETQPNNQIPLPKATVALVHVMERAAHSGGPHPGLWLDKFIRSWDAAAPSGKLSERVQKPAVEQIARLSDAVPRSGLKGMAHAYACQVWLPAEAGKSKATGQLVQDHVDNCWEHILRVFGYGDAPWFRKLRERTTDAVRAATGQQVTLFEPTKEADRQRQARILPAGTAGAKTAAGYGSFEVPGPTTIATAPKAIKLELISPAFLGGHDRNAEKVARLPSVKAWLRQWWRAWHGHLPVDELRRQEGAVFGSIESGTRLRLSHARQNPLKTLPKGQDFGGGGSALGYLGFGPVACERAKKGNRTQVDALAPDQTIRFRLTHPSQSAMDECLRSLWVACALGGVGSRNRRGWGSLLLAGDQSVPDLPNLRTSKTVDEYRIAMQQGLERLAATSARRTASDTHWSALSRETRVALSPSTFPNWRAAMEDLGKKFIAFRGRDKRGVANGDPGPDYYKTKAQLRGELPDDKTLPERAAFGMPYAQAYTRLPKVHPRRSPTAAFTPVWSENNKTIEGRRASPLFCKIVRLAGGQFLWQVAFLPSQFLPAGATVRGERTDVEPKKLLPVSSFGPPSSFGVERASTGRRDTLLTDFLDWLEGKRAARIELPPEGSPTQPVPKHAAKAERGTTKPKPVNQGQERTDGTLKRKDNRWVVVFEGDEREAEIVNPEQLPPDVTEATRCEFRVMQQSKQTGITVRFNRILKGK